MLLFRGDGTGLFRQTLTEMMYEQATLGRWFLSVVDHLAQRGDVHAVDIQGAAWSEVDFPADLATAEALVAGWRANDAKTVSLP
jgi:choline kinase